MNHSINLLEPDEIRYLSAAESNPLYKMVGAGVLVAVFAGVALYYFSLKATISNAEDLSNRWNAIEADVESAKLLSDKRQRLEKGLQTLNGWKASRVNYNELMTFVVSQIPVSLETIQISRLEVSETMQGLRKQTPSSKKANFHPLKRSIRLSLRGTVQSTSPERLLSQFQRNLTGAEAPVEFESVQLDRYTQLRDENGDITDRTTFAFSIRLVPQEVMP